MAKNLKLNIKNAQLAEALKFNQLKKKPPQPKAIAPKAEETLEPVAPVVPEKESIPAPETMAAEPTKLSLPPQKEVVSEPPQAAPEKPSPDRRVFAPSFRDNNSYSGRHYSPDRGARPSASSSFIPRQPVRPQPQQLPTVPDKDNPKKDPAALSSFKKGVKNAGFEEDAPKKAAVYKDHRPDPALKKKLDVQRTFDSRDRHGLRDNDNEGWRKRRAYKPKLQFQEEVIRPKKLSIRLPISIKDLASAMKLKASQLVAKLFMQGITLTLNDFLDDETIVQLLGHEFECELTIDTSEEDRIKITDKTIKQEITETDPATLQLRPPVVAFMGHVDHGKTSLIDYIRTSDIAAGEAGAITQHIGAFQCHTSVGPITILDTPGHEAFSEMRSRGADVTDIVVLVIAGDEGIRAQTLEAMRQAEEAKVTVVVAINKCDKPNFNAENVYRQLSENNHLPEAWGGTTITVNCSATTGEGIPQLLEMLALQAEVLELKASSVARARGTIIESQMHKGLGAIATILVQNGTLRLGDPLVVGEYSARIKTMQDEHGKALAEAGPSTPVKITGLSGLPLAGSEFIVVKSEKEAKDLSQKRSEGQKQTLFQTKKMSMESMIQKNAENVQKKYLPLILKADVQGSLEALKTSLLKIPSNKVMLTIISSGVGEISESDIELAAASKASIIGFHTGIESHAENLLKENNVKMVQNDIIYHLVDEVKKLMLAQLDKLSQENDMGKAEVKATFKSSQLGLIAGCIVVDGSIKRNQHVRVIRGDEVIWKGAIASLKKVKEDVREVGKGQECGILLQGFSAVQPGDILQSFETIYLEQEL